MPTTYNGIGTHYYGRKNEEKRQATCQQCGHNVQLTSYDTRLWFVIVFIPVIRSGASASSISARPARAIS